MNYETVIGLEVHVQLKTATKAFCSCANIFGEKENTNICPVCLGLPGSLPVLNANVLKAAIKVALSLNCTPKNFTKFDRKNYFYPDLPKNFQISQFDMPLAEYGFLDIDISDSRKRVHIKRVHLEEDAGKLLHPEGASFSYVDFNRAGTPLLEIVSEPDLRTPDEAYQYLGDLKLILQYLDVSDCDMEKGSLRCDANISIRPAGETKLGTKTELKNMNSFKAVRSALEYEILRQSGAVEKGERIIQETRLWDEKKGLTISMRSKEEAHDYRYFPEPDLPPFVFSDADIEKIRQDIGEMPKDRLKRFTKVLLLSETTAHQLVSNKIQADFYEGLLGQADPDDRLKFATTCANWVLGVVLSESNVRGLPIDKLVGNGDLLKLILLVEDGIVSNLTAKSILTEMIDTRKNPDQIVREKNLGQVSDISALKTIIDDVIKNNQKSVEDYRAGKENALMFLVGQAMKLSKGKANPKVAKDLILRALKNPMLSDYTD